MIGYFKLGSVKVNECPVGVEPLARVKTRRKTLVKIRRYTQLRVVPLFHFFCCYWHCTIQVLTFIFTFRSLRLRLSTEADEVALTHVNLALDEIDKIVRELFTPHLTQEPRMFVTN